MVKPTFGCSPRALDRLKPRGPYTLWEPHKVEAAIGSEGRVTLASAVQTVIAY